MAGFQPIHFIPRHRQAEMLELQVESIIVAPHSQKSRTNHWCFYLSTSKWSSVRIDCQPSYSVPSSVLRGGSKANIVISELPCLVSHDAQAQFKLDIPANLKVKSIHDLLVQNGRHKYEFDSNGVGCRFWTMDQLDLLHQNLLITNEAQLVAAKEAILKLWPDQTPLRLDQGSYYQ
ncbi:hypothetical protein BJX63DRAFT_426256 [Aspergillus granulosus]|uniref:DUF7770 domain-containing protein n=1 Tax=Aspergillus granulosus TaxID=176169 RepID=A0ABR4GSY9_9EURO